MDRQGRQTRRHGGGGIAASKNSPADADGTRSIIHVAIRRGIRIAHRALAGGLKDHQKLNLDKLLDPRLTDCAIDLFQEIIGRSLASSGRCERAQTLEGCFEGLPPRGGSCLLFIGKKSPSISTERPSASNVEKVCWQSDIPGLRPKISIATNSHLIWFRGFMSPADKNARHYSSPSKKPSAGRVLIVQPLRAQAMGGGERFVQVL
ncbi:hypothetical protein At12D13_48440 (plasmid) [Agrobacterium fabrum]|nr:hypothetical protein At12D13_48440 [Agrobacterium fabrum]